MGYIYHADLEALPDGVFAVSFPDVPEIFTSGKNRKEALSNARDALGFALRLRYADNEDVPAAKYQGGIPVSVDAWNALKLSVIEAFNQSGITKREFAGRLGKDDKEAQRILAPNHATRTRTLEQALDALGQQVIVIVRPAAAQKAA